MKKSFIALLLFLGLASNYAFAEGNSIAVVDLQKLVSIVQLEEKYTREFNTKKQALEKDYNTRLSNIEKSIQAEIEKKAQKDKYDYVFAKSVVLYGGKDITSEINVK